jgi:hypothetical protein
MANQPTPRTVQAPPDLPAMPDVSTTLSGYLRNFSLWCRHGFADKLSGTVAQPGLMLQGYDAAAGVNPAIYMLEVSQAGVAALAPMALGGGAMGAPVPIASRKGVTNGSNAAAGDIGEVLSAASGTITFPGGTWVNTITMTLTPGDWDVHGEARINVGAAAANNVAAATSNVATGPGGPGSYFQMMSSLIANGNNSFGLRSTRWNVTVNTTVYLPVYLASAGNGVGILWARRAR